jgi:N-acetyltransferase
MSLVLSARSRTRCGSGILEAPLSWVRRSLDGVQSHLVGDYSWTNPVVLRGAHVTLEPLTVEHHDDLVEAVADGRLWELWYTYVPEPVAMRREIERRLAQADEGKMLPFTVIATNTGRAVGMTTYLNIDAPNRHVEIGATWYRKAVQRTAINTEAKLLLLTHAFDTLNCIAVEFRTASLNLQSRVAIERLGAKLDGVLRSSMLYKNGEPRDSCSYSIIAAEWKCIRARLEGMLVRRT